MKRKVLLFALLSSIGLAQAETVDFSGAVTTSCSFSSPQAGSLSASAVGNRYVLDAGFNNAGAASMQIAYTGAPTFTVNAVNNVTGSNGVPTIESITTGVSFGDSGNNSNALSAGANSFTTGSKSFNLDSNSSSDTVSVKMRVIATSPFAVGNYSANAVITCQ